LHKKRAEPRGGLLAFGRWLWHRCRAPAIDDRFKVGRSTIDIKMAIHTTKAA